MRSISFDSMYKSQRVSRLSLGKSVNGVELVAWAFAPHGKTAPRDLDDFLSPERAPKEKWFLLLAGVHGDEVEGIHVVEKILEGMFQEEPFENIGLIIWSQGNPDGTTLGQRQNANGIDLNRNLPTRDWTPEVKNPRYPPGPHAASEPETKALLLLLEKTKPMAILSAHSFSKPMVNSNGPARPWAEGISAVCSYPVTEDMGYPTPGCLGTYAGHERNIPTITLEILRGEKEEVYLSLHTMTIMAAIAYWDDRLKESIN